jgi:hypothetical protein
LDYYKIAASSGDESHKGGAKELRAKEIIHVETIYSDVKGHLSRLLMWSGLPPP